MFITFGSGQKINGHPLDNLYMVIKEEQIPDVIEKNEAGFYVFCGRYPDEDLQRQIDEYGIKEITIEEYQRYQIPTEQFTPAMALKSNAGWYVGHLYWDEDMNGWFPWSRETEYMTADEAATTTIRWLQERGAPDTTGT